MNSQKLVVNPELIEALKHFSRFRLYPEQEAATAEYFITGIPGNRRSWSVEQVCGAALALLQDEYLAGLELDFLKKRIRERGLEDMWLMLMGQKLEAAK